MFGVIRRFFEAAGSALDIMPETDYSQYYIADEREQMIEDWLSVGNGLRKELHDYQTTYSKL